MASEYSPGQVRGLIENYAELREVKATYRVGLNILVMLCDLDRAIRLLGPKEYQAVLLHGQLRHTVRDAEQALEVSRSTLQDRYEAGIERIVHYLNNGDDPPLCDCHQKPMFYSDGYWRCRVKKDASRKRYERTAKARARQDRYSQSAKGRARRVREDVARREELMNR